jgi:hypothetical protein
MCVFACICECVCVCVYLRGARRRCLLGTPGTSGESGDSNDDDGDCGCGDGGGGSSSVGVVRTADYRRQTANIRQQTAEQPTAMLGPCPPTRPERRSHAPPPSVLLAPALAPFAKEVISMNFSPPSL